MSEYNEDPAAFNMGLHTLSRINFELWHCNTARREHSLDSWWTSLLNIYVELEAFMTEKERGEHKLIHKLCESSYNNLSQYNQNFNNSMKSTRNVSYNPPRQSYDEFIKWEMELRKCMDKHGLLMKKGESAIGAMI
tara:strand:+ start:530 stop:937 length:408 start_codon:yes stop_codon:yes gene_type:complete